MENERVYFTKCLARTGLVYWQHSPLLYASSLNTGELEFAGTLESDGVVTSSHMYTYIYV